MRKYIQNLRTKSITHALIHKVNIGLSKGLYHPLISVTFIGFVLDWSRSLYDLKSNCKGDEYGAYDSFQFFKKYMDLLK